MNILKHMEAIFLATLAVAGPASVIYDTLGAAQAKPATAALASNKAPAMPVVVVSAKRMSRAEKQQSMAEEARLEGMRMAARGSI